MIKRPPAPAPPDPGIRPGGIRERQEYWRQFRANKNVKDHD